MIHRIPVILYDQLGNGRFTHLRDKPAEFWTIDLFVAELESLLVQLGIQDTFSLFGHSWGGILGAEFAVRKQPPGLKHLILSNSLGIRSVAAERRAAPAGVPEGRAQRDGGGNDGQEEVPGGAAAVPCCAWLPHPAYSCRVRPCYRTERRGRGRSDCGERADISQDFVVAPFFRGIEKVKWLTLEQSSHTPFYEERELFTQLVAAFLKLDD
ncbi:alpha/beta-hydrolase [Pilatotrama ljubarskyi]|nr:alpha/beta-hydrolase [Pilatotrama ljubarskyi]